MRFARSGQAIPNVEVKLSKDFLDSMALQDQIKVMVKGGYFYISNIAMQVAYKRYVLMSDKDIEDAQYLQNVFSISEENINKCKRILLEYGRC